ncbi:MAG TPA: hypothetical protein VK307_08855 [Thermoleophilaceae bacterium]|nr:hypothetical protein [Thermoleophilaceae bacterium]
MSFKHAVLFSAVCLVALTALPAVASATQRYASPTGTSPYCFAASPCSAHDAVAYAAAGDEVILAPGVYLLGGTIGDNADITIHGVAGQPRPRLLFTGAGQDGLQLDNGSLLRWVEIVQTETDRRAVRGVGARFDQVVVKAATEHAEATWMRGGTMRDTLVIASGADASALYTESYGGTVETTYRNVTAVATGTGAVPVMAMAANTGTVTARLVNVIAYAPTSGHGIVTGSLSATATAVARVTHSSYQDTATGGYNAAIADDGGNRVGVPAFVDAAAGDYRQAAGSYTIDAGLDEPINGAFDLEGDPRRVGVTDIGADEYVAATPTGTPPPVAPGASGGSGGTTPSSIGEAFAGVTLVSTRLSFNRRVIRLTLRCPAATVGGCSGRTSLTARRRSRSGARRTIGLGRARFRLAAGARVRVAVRVPRAGRRLLRRVPQLGGRATNAARDGAGHTTTTVARVTVRRRLR